MGLKYDRIGTWSLIKLDIIREYASAYSKILSKRFHHVYIDAFAGPGKHIDIATGCYVAGSPQIALDIIPPFKEYHLIDIDSAKVNELLMAVAKRPEANIYYGDCNSILLKYVFPKVRYEDYKRGLCLLDPYGLHLKWEVIKTAGQMRSIEIFLNFPIADINRNVLWNNPDLVRPSEIKRMNDYWGDESWKEEAYNNRSNLFGWYFKEDGKRLTLAFHKRLKEVAGFNHVSEPLPMRNSKGNIIYYLFFASHEPLAINIIEDIFNKYRKQGVKQWH